MKNKFVVFMILPFITLLMMFIYYPFFKSIYNSFYNFNFNTREFIGVENYIRVIKEVHRETFFNTAMYVLFSVIIEIVIACPLAYVLKNQFKGRGLVIALLILPWITPPAVNGVIWRWIYDGSYGLLNDILMKLNIIDNSKVWLASRLSSLFLIGMVHVWKVIPFMTLVFLSQLQKIPKELYEAGRVDGLKENQILVKLIIPMMKSTLCLMALQGIISAVQIFDEVYVLTGFSLDTRSLMIEDYLMIFSNLKMGQGTALALIVMTVSTLPMLLYRSIRIEKEKI